MRNGDVHSSISYSQLSYRARLERNLLSCDTIYRTMGQVNNQSQRKSPESDYLNQLGGLAVIQQQLAEFDGIAPEVEEALNGVGILQLFSADRSNLSPEQVELLNKAAGGIQQLVELLSAAMDNVDKIKP